jgi:Fe2+ transport system protein FeoA
MDAAAHGSTPLSALPRGVEAEVVAVAGDSAVARRLGAMGFMIGARVAAVGRMPFGDPLVIALEGTRLALRKDEAALVLVTPCAGEAR